MNRVKRYSSQKGRKRVIPKLQDDYTATAIVQPVGLNESQNNESVETDSKAKEVKPDFSRISVDYSSRSHMLKNVTQNADSMNKDSSQIVNLLQQQDLDSSQDQVLNTYIQDGIKQIRQVKDMMDSSSFSKSADETYEHLKNLTQQQWSSYGIFEFDINIERGFLLQGELQQNSQDRYFVQQGLKIYYINIRQSETIEQMQKEKYSPTCVFESPKFEHFKFWSDSIILVRTKKKLRVFQSEQKGPTSQFNKLISQIELQPQQMRDNPAHIELEKTKNLVYIINGNSQLLKLHIDSKTYELSEKGAFNCEHQLIYFKLVTSKRDKARWLVVWSKKNALDEYGMLQVIEKESMALNEKIKKAITDQISAMCITESGEQIVIGMANGDIQLWSITSEALQCQKRIMKYHQKKVSALLCFDDKYLVSGASYDDYIVFWNLKNLKKCAQTPCKGDIKGFHMRSQEEIIVQSSDGIFLFDDVLLNRSRKMPPIQKSKLISSDNICIFNDRNRYAAGFWETQLILSTFLKPKDSKNQKDLLKKFSQKVIEIKTCNNANQQFIFVNTAKSDEIGKNRTNGQIVKLDTKDLKEVTQFVLSDKNQKFSHNTFSIHSKQQNECLITTGAYGVLIFSSKGTLGSLLHHILPISPSNQQRNFTSCKFIQQLEAFACGTEQGFIEFFTFNEMQEPFKKLNTKLDKKLEGHFCNIESYEGNEKYCEIISSDLNLPKHQQYIAQGSQCGDIIIWRIIDIQKYDLPFAVLPNQGATIDLKFIQVTETNVNLLISLHKNPNKVVISSLKNMIQMDVIPIDAPAKKLIVCPFDVNFVYVVIDNLKNSYGSNLQQIEIGYRLKLFNRCKQSIKDMHFLQVYQQIQDQDNIRLKNILDSYNKHGCIDALHRINLFNFCSLNPSFIGLKQFIRYQIPCLVDSNGYGPSEFLKEKGNIIGLNCMFEMVQGVTQCFDGQKMELKLPLNQTLLLNGLKLQEDWVQEQTENESNQIVQFPIFWDDTQEVIFGQFKRTFGQRLRDYFWDYQNVRIFEHGSKFISLEVLEDHIDFQKKKLKNKKKIECKYVTVPFNLARGSDSSLDFLTNVQQLSDLALYSEFSILIHYKWQQNQSRIMLHTLVFLIYTAFIDYEIIQNRKNLKLAVYHEIYQQPELTIIIIGYTIAQILYESIQLLLEGPKVYFKSHINLMETSGYLCMLAYFSMKFAQQPENDKEWKRWIGYMQGFISIGSFFLNYRALYHFRVFSSMMMTIMTVLDESIKYLFGYISLLYIFIFIISISQFALSEKETFFERTFLEQYDVLYAGSQKDIRQMGLAALIIYFIQTNFMIIICLNIVISVLCDKYDMVMQRIDAMNLLTRAQIMHEAESTILFKNEKGYDNYIYFLQYSNEKFINPVDESVEVSKFRMLKNMLQGYHFQLKKKLNKLKKEIKATKKSEKDDDELRIAQLIDQKIEERLATTKISQNVNKQIEAGLKEMVNTNPQQQQIKNVQLSLAVPDISSYDRLDTQYSDGQNMFGGIKRRTLKVIDEIKEECSLPNINPDRRYSNSLSPPKKRSLYKTKTLDSPKIKKQIENDPTRRALRMFKTKLEEINVSPEMFYRICDWSYNKSITVLQFEEGLKRLKVDIPASQLDQLVNIFDEKKVNKITYDEYFGTLDAYYIRSEEQSFQELNGEITYEKRASFQLIELMLDRKITSDELFRLIDENASGQINLDEFRQAMHVFGFFEEKQIECLKNLLDRNKNGILDRSEFIAQLHQMKRIYCKYKRQEKLEQIV